MTYVCLIRFTDKGAADLRNSTSRAQAFSAAASASGVETVAQYWTVGSCDGVLIVRSDSEEKALHWLTQLDSDGYVKTETLRAFNAEEFSHILSD